MSSTDEKRKMNQEGSMTTKIEKESRQMKEGKVDSDKSEERNLTNADVTKINKEREKLESLYYIRRDIKSLEGLNMLLKKRKEFWEKNHQVLAEFVLWGRYLLTYRGTIQLIDQKYLCGKPVEVTTLKDFMKMVSSLRTREIRDFPQAPCFCQKCLGPITIEDIANGRVKVRKKKFVHSEH